MLLNVLDFTDDSGQASLALALETARDGDRIYLPSSQVYVAPPTGWLITRGVEIFGDGPDFNAGGTFLKGSGGGDGRLLVIRPSPGSTMGPVYIHDLRLEHAQHGIECDIAEGTTLKSLRLARLVVWHMGEAPGYPGCGLLLDAGDGTIERIATFACLTQLNKQYVIKLRNVGQAELMAGGGGTNGVGYVWGGGSCVRVCVSYAQGDAFDTGADGQIHLDSCGIAHVEAFHFEDIRAKAPVFPWEPAFGCRFDQCRGAAFFGSNYVSFDSTDSGPSIIGFYVPAADGPVTLFPNDFGNINGEYLLRLGGEAPGYSILPQYSGTVGLRGEVAMPSTPNYGLLGIPSVRDPAAEFNARSGFALPALLDAPMNPVEGMIYCGLDGVLRVWTENGWRSVSVTPSSP